MGWNKQEQGSIWYEARIGSVEYNKLQGKVGYNSINRFAKNQYDRISQYDPEYAASTALHNARYNVLNNAKPRAVFIYTDVPSKEQITFAKVCLMHKIHVHMESSEWEMTLDDVGPMSDAEAYAVVGSWYGVLNAPKREEKRLEKREWKLKRLESGARRDYAIAKTLFAALSSKAKLHDLKDPRRVAHLSHWLRGLGFTWEGSTPKLYGEDDHCTSTFWARDMFKITDENKEVHEDPEKFEMLMSNAGIRSKEARTECGFEVRVLLAAMLKWASGWNKVDVKKYYAETRGGESKERATDILESLLDPEYEVRDGEVERKLLPEPDAEMLMTYDSYDILTAEERQLWENDCTLDKSHRARVARGILIELKMRTVRKKDGLRATTWKNTPINYLNPEDPNAVNLDAPVTTYTWTSEDKLRYLKETRIKDETVRLRTKKFLSK